MNWLATLVVMLLRAFLPALAQASKDTCEDGAGDAVLRDRLRKRVRSTWRSAATWTLVPIMWLLMSGCFARTIYVPDGTPVRLRQTVRDAKVWVLDKEGKPVAGRMDLPEGWFCLPDPGPRE